MADFFGQYLDMIVRVAAAGAAVVGLHRMMVRPFMRKIEAMATLVEAQLTANGGGSLVDKVARISVIEGLVRDNHKLAENHWKLLEERVESVEKQLPRER